MKYFQDVFLLIGIVENSLGVLYIPYNFSFL